MDDKANKILADLLQKASDGVDSAVAFSQAQIPEVVHQLLVWNVVSSAGSQLLGIALIVLSFAPPAFSVRSRKSGRQWTASDREPLDSWFMPSALYILCTFVAPAIGSVVGIITISFNFDWLKIWLAPKLYLLEYAASLIK